MGRARLKRYGAAVVFLLAVTIAVLLVRSGLRTDSAPATTTVRTKTAKPPPKAAKRRRRFYSLRAGQTLSDVAIRYHTSVEKLLALNPRLNPNALRVGQRIRVR